MGCLAIFLLRNFFEVELGSTFHNGLQQLATPLHSVSPLQQRFSQFCGSFNKGEGEHFSFFVPKGIARQVAEKIEQCNRVLRFFFDLDKYLNCMTLLFTRKKVCLLRYSFCNFFSLAKLNKKFFVPYICCQPSNVSLK